MRGVIQGGHAARGLFVAAVAFVAVAIPTPARAASAPYTATANARLVGVDFTTVPPIAFPQLIDAGVSVAQAQVDSLGGTRAFASSPYPSNSVVLLPGLVAGVTKGQTSALIPDYPLIAASNETTPSDHRELATIVMDAESAVGNSRGTVTDGLTRGEAVTLGDDTKIKARAETTISSIKLASFFSIDGVRTVAEASRGLDGTVQRSSSFEVAALTILGQRIALSPDTLSVLGRNTRVGLDQNGVIGQLVKRLHGRGVDIAYVPAVKDDDGITAAGLIIDMVEPVPPALASGLKEARARITLGLASASVSNRVVGTRPASPVIVPVDSPSITGGFDDVPFVAPSVLSGGTALTPITPDQVSSSHSLPVDLSLSSLYPVLVFAAVIGVGLVNLIRHLGVRSP